MWDGPPEGRSRSVRRGYLDEVDSMEGISMSTAVQHESGVVGAFALEEIDDPSFLVAYAKIVEDKDDGVYMQGVYFGGVATDQKKAEQIARECVNTMKGGTILPKIVPINGRDQVLAAMGRVEKRFQELEVQIFHAEDIMSRAHARRK